MRKVIDYIVLKGKIEHQILDANIITVIKKLEESIKKNKNYQSIELKEIETFEKAIPYFDKIYNLKSSSQPMEEKQMLFMQLKSLVRELWEEEELSIHSNSRLIKLEEIKRLEKRVIIELEKCQQKRHQLKLKESELREIKDSLLSNPKFSNPNARTTFELEVQKLISEGYELHGGVSNSSLYVTQALVKYDS